MKGFYGRYHVARYEAGVAYTAAAVIAWWESFAGCSYGHYGSLDHAGQGTWKEFAPQRMLAFAVDSYGAWKSVPSPFGVRPLSPNKVVVFVGWSTIKSAWKKCSIVGGRKVAMLVAFSLATPATQGATREGM